MTNPTLAHQRNRYSSTQLNCQDDQRVRVQVTSDEVQQPITKEVSTRVYADQ